MRRMKCFRCVFLFPACLLLLDGLASVHAEVKSAVNWGEFMARHDLIWTNLPRQWPEGAFIGNGLLGAMIYSEGTNLLQWDVGRSDVTDRGERLAIGKFALV